MGFTLKHFRWNRLVSVRIGELWPSYKRRIEMEDYDKYLLEVDLTEYKIKRELCESCANYYECRGPSVFDTECPKNFIYTPIYEIIK